MATLLPAAVTLAAQDIGLLRTSDPDDVPLGWSAPICPNFSDWAPGDVLLVHRSGGPSDVTGGMLEGAQRIALMAKSRPEARYSHITHAGIYVGMGQVVDAVPREGVRCISVWELAGHRALQVRRLRGFDGVAIATYALERIGARYSVLNLIRDGFIDARVDEYLSGMYCTQLILRASNHTDPYSRNLAQDPGRNPFFPAMLVTHPSLDDVQVSWRQCWQTLLRPM